MLKYGRLDSFARRDDSVDSIQVLPTDCHFKSRALLSAGWVGIAKARLLLRLNIRGDRKKAQ